jgi:hypothetical protein
MKYYLTAQTLNLMQDLRTEVIDSIKSKALPEAIKNDLQLQFNTWLDTRSQSLYKDGAEMPDTFTPRPIADDNYAQP